MAGPTRCTIGCAFWAAARAGHPHARLVSSRYRERSPLSLWERAEDLPSPFGRGAGGEGGSELFAKPDDRCEVNDVASRCREVAECLQDALGQYELTLPTGRVLDLPPLSDVLRNGM